MALGIPLGLAFLLVLGGVRGVRAQEAGWRAPFARGQEALARGDTAGYGRAMAEAAGAMEPGLLNRPFVQYHAARGAAMSGRADEAVTYLDRMWMEDIEALMTAFLPYDPAFDGMRDHPGYRAVLRRPAERDLVTEPLGGPLHRIIGAGANVMASVGPDGVLLVDTGYGPALPALRRALASLGGPTTVHTLILTHPHEDHWGAAVALADEALVLAHPGTAEAAAEPYTFIPGVEIPPRPPEGRPDRTLTDTTFAFNGEEIRIFGVEAHTGADLAVHFTGSRVVALGDAWLEGEPMMFPGSREPEAFLDRLDAFLAGLPDQTVVVGGHDPPTTPDGVRRQIRASRVCLERGRVAAAEGRELETTLEGADEACPRAWLSFFYRVAAAQAG